jgi:hypothetical protein
MLTWAFSDAGNVVKAEEVRRLPRNQRPRCKCPACNRELGPVRSPLGNIFFRHINEGEPCYATAPEGALHLEAKRLLREHLSFIAKEQRTLELTYSCESCKTLLCVAAPPLHPGDIIREEEWLDPLKTRKPDLTAWRGGKRIALYEILSTHACDDDKWSELRATLLPVVEIRAAVIAGMEGRPAWSPNTPLPIERAIGINRQLICAGCEAEVRRREELREHERQQLAADAEAAKEERQRHFNTRYEHIRQIWFIDLHYPSGRLSRRRLIASEREYRGQWEYRLLNAEGSVMESWEPQHAPRPDFESTATQAVRALVDKIASSIMVRITQDNEPEVDSEEEALQISGPTQNLWWAESSRRWVEGYNPAYVRNLFPRRLRLRVWMWLKSGIIPILDVRPFSGASIRLRIAEKSLVDEFISFSHGGPYPERLKNAPPEIKSRLKDIQEAYRNKHTRRQITSLPPLSLQEPQPSTPERPLQLSDAQKLKIVWGKKTRWT